jgi:hypothetical protein
MRRISIVVALLALAFAPAAGAASPRLSPADATARFLAYPKVADWLDRYPPNPQTAAERDGDSWTVRVWSGAAGEVAEGKVDDRTGRVVEAWTGPQVAWKLARGSGSFGGRTINSLPVWLGFCGVFLLGLADWRRPLSVRNLDLLALLSFSVSLWFFQDGNIFASVPLQYPPLVYLLGRMAWIARRGTVAPVRSVWPVWALAAAAVFLAGFKVGLNVRASSVIDVGYSGVVGGDRIVHGEMPYGHMPLEEGTPCGKPDADGKIRDRIQTNGRCESANPRGDTYGPVAYLAYVPAVLTLGWAGRWDTLPAAHGVAIAFDLLCIVGLALVGRRFGGNRLGATLAFAWAAYPFTQYVSSTNTNDAIMPALLVFGFWLATMPAPRGALVALAGWTKFAALLVAPLWLAYGGARRCVLGFAAATAAAFSILLLEPDVLHAARVFADRTVIWQVGRESPFSLWDWGQYHARGLPDLHVVQHVLQALLVVGAAAAPFALRRGPTPLRLAALTAALLLGFELVLTHWFYLYIPWFFPFVAFAVLAPAVRPEPIHVESPGRREALVAA